MLTPLLIALVVGYLLGALPFGYLVARAKGVNIFEVGSKNPGATNVRRVLGRGPGNLVLFLDALKGAAATFAPWGFRLWSQRDSSVTLTPALDATAFGYLAIAGLVGALLGHSFSCFTHFRGGKGVATGAGGFAVLFPLGAALAIVVWLLTLAITRYVSVASMLAAASLPFAAFSFSRPRDPALIAISAAVAIFVAVRHRGNIARLRAGTEAKVGQAKAEQKL
ncbi:MAG TPA: glycerol-3-phosphate 1-O-acyltransferase PlsY [Opitutaceae bacterium]|nr:glycerol-3-phosphate 1-O-acyltransferase PlsY [Opitutaceae bacterium]